MSTNPQQLVQKLWNYCNILRDDGLSRGRGMSGIGFLGNGRFLARENRRIQENLAAALRSSLDQRMFSRGLATGW